MANLSNIINTIRTAIYGKDMREALAQGFEAIDKEMEGGMGGGFVLMESSLPTGQRKPNVLYGLIVGNFDDEGPEA